jgi:ATP-dependent Clp protease ATP-binding subunit ClpC
LDTAVSLATRAGAPAVGTEHLLVGVVRVGDATVEAILSELNTSSRAIDEAIAAAVQPPAPSAPRPGTSSGGVTSDDDTPSSLPDLPLTPRWRRVLRSSRVTSRLKQALAVAEDDARARGASAIEPVHLLLAAVRDPGSAAARVVRPLGIDYESIRRVLRAGPAPVVAAPPPAKGRASAAAPSPNLTLTLPADVAGELRALAAARETTVDQLVLRFVRLGLLAVAVQEKPNGAVILREGSREREILLI